MNSSRPAKTRKGTTSKWSPSIASRSCWTRARCSLLGDRRLGSSRRDAREPPRLRAAGVHPSTGGIGERSARGRTRTGMGLPPRDFLTRYSFRCCARRGHARIWGLDFTFALPPITGPKRVSGGLGRGRQVSTLSRRPRGPHPAEQGRGRPSGLARCCSHRDVLLVHRL
jgi:hypothetical protein